MKVFLSLPLHLGLHCYHYYQNTGRLEALFYTQKMWALDIFHC